MSVLTFKDYYEEEYWDEEDQRYYVYDKPEITHYACAACGSIKSIKKSPPHKALIAFTTKDTQKEFEYYVKWKMLCEECFLDKEEETKKECPKKKG